MKSLEQLKQLVSRLRALVFYRALLDLPPMASYLDLLDLLSDPSSSQAKSYEMYAEWNSRLLAASPDASWANWLTSEILQSMNPLTTNPVDDSKWREALQEELDTLLKAVHTGGEELAELLGVPVYDLGIGVVPSADEGVTYSFGQMRETFLTLEDPAEAASAILTFHRTYGYGMPVVYKATMASPEGLTGITRMDPVMPEDLFDYSGNVDKLRANTEALLARKPSAHVLLYGSRGCGKSSAVKAMVNQYETQGLRLVEINPRDLGNLHTLLDRIERSKLFFILFIDDLSFRQTDKEYTELKSFLQGGAREFPENCRLYVTSNRRHLVLEQLDETEQELYANDGQDERISLSDRFGLKLHFLKPLMREYLEVVHFLAEKAGVTLPNSELDLKASAYATKVGHRSPREAQQFMQAWLAADEEFL